MSAPVVHLELHTDDKPAAAAILGRLLGWRSEQIETAAGSYLYLSMGKQMGGGIVACGTQHPQWMPYAAVACLEEAAAMATDLGGQVVVEPREGPSGWRSVVTSPASGFIGLWQPRR